MSKRHDDCFRPTVRSLLAIAPLGALLALGAVLTRASTARATPRVVHDAKFALAQQHPLARFVDGERRARQVPTRLPPERLETHRSMRSALDCEHANHDVALDPATGVTTAHFDLRVRAEGRALSSIGFSMDQGLAPSTITASGREVVVSEAVVEPIRVVQLTFSPALEPGESTWIHIPYGGTLACGTYPEGGGILCAKGIDFSYFAHQSLIPYVFDPSDRESTTLDAMTRNIVLRVPGSTDIISTGERVSETVHGGTKVSTWVIDRPLSRSLGIYVLAGKLGMKSVPDRAVPTTFVFPNPELPVDDRLVSWSGRILDFVEQSSGSRLPFRRGLTLVRLPRNVVDPGTATFGMTLLSDSYTQAGTLLHEETWAHENSHLIWGIVVPEADSAESRMMSEGLATLSQIEYSWSRHFSQVDRDAYLARRFVPIGLDLRTQGQGLPPIALGTEAPPASSDPSAYTLWAYYKTAATLDHLRVTIGDEAFAAGLGAYVERCSYVGCRPRDFREVLEKVTGRALSTFFDRWVLATSRPRVVVGFKPAAGGADIELSKDDALPMTLELWLGLENGQRIKQRVDLKGLTTKMHLDTPVAVRSVALSPRHDVLVETRSTLEGDLDFDGETDGNDLLRCTPLVGVSYTSTNAVGLWNTEDRFDPRCDVDGNYRIDDDDLTELARSFGKVRTP